MRSQILSHSVRRRWPVLLAGAAAVTSAPQAEAADWTKHFRVGMKVTLNIEAEFSGGGGFLDFPSQPGRYENGYVLRDNSQPDGDPDTPDLTTNWGYDFASQFNDTTRLMTFSRTESFAASEIHEATEDDTPYVGAELAYGTAITRWGDALIGWEAGYSFTPISITDSRRISGTATRVSVSHEIPDGVLVPDPGHRGTASGGGQATFELDPTGDPVFREEDAFLKGSRTLDVSLHTLRAGPTIHLELARRWAFQGGFGPAVGYVTGDYEFDESVTGSTSRSAEGSFGSDEFVYGGYAQALLLFHFEEHGDIYAGLQFMGLTGSDFEEGDRKAKLNMGATLSFLVGVNWPF